MANVSAPGGRSGSGKKALNVDLNLVPFIDMLSCLICFLLMTAVWVQIGKISVTQSGQGAIDSPPQDRNRLNLVVAITTNGFFVTGNGTPFPDGDITKKDNEYDFDRLGKKLKEIHGSFPDKNDIVVNSEDAIKYQDLINTMDVCLANSFQNISVSGTI
jgi:biopolymer transport protein TolR